MCIQDRVVYVRVCAKHQMRKNYSKINYLMRSGLRNRLQELEKLKPKQQRK